MGILNTDEAMFWATGIDVSGLDVDAKKIEQIFQSLVGNTGKSFDKLNTAFQVFEKVKDGYSTGVFNIGKRLIAMGASANVARVASMALMGTLTLGLGAALAGAVILTKKWIDKQKELREEFNKFNKVVAETAGSQISSYEKMRRSYNLLGNDIKAKEKWILENKKAFDDLGVAVNTVNDADNIFINNTEAFKNAILARAKAAAAEKLVIEKYEEALKKRGEAGKMKDTRTRLDSAEGTGLTYEVENKAKTKLIKEASEFEKEAKSYVDMQISAEKESAQALKQVGVDSANTIKEGTKAYWDARKENAQARLDAMTVEQKGSKDWEKTVNEIKTADRMIEKYNLKGSGGRSGSSRIPEDLSIGIKEAQLKLEAERIAIMTDGKAKRLKLSEQEWKEETAQLEKEHAERLKKHKEQGIAVSQAEIDTYNERMKISSDAKTKRDADIEREYKTELAELYKNLGDVFLTEEEKKKKAIKERYDEERKIAKERLAGGSITREQYADISSKINAAETEEHRKRMLEGLDSFKQQEADAVKYWNERIAEIENDLTLTEIERMNALKEAKKRYNDEINELNAHALTQSEDWIELFADTANLTDKEIDNLIKSIKDKLSSGEYQLNPIDAQNFIRSLEEARDGMKNPINQIISGFEAYRQAREKQADAERKLANWKAIGAPAEDIKDATNEVKKFKTEAQAAATVIANAFKDAKQLIDGIGSAISDVAGSFGGDTRQLENVTKLLGGVATAGQGIAQIVSGNPAEMISGIVNVVKGLADVIVSINSISDTERQKRIEKLAESVEKAKKKYEELGYAREKAFSSDKAKIIEEQNRLTEQQVRDIDKMIAEEEKKKNTDSEAVKRMKEEQEVLRNQIRENSESAKEAIVGTDIMSAIEQFAQAYADAWAGGETAAANSAKAIKNIIKGGLMEALKNDIKSDAKKVYDAIHDALKNDDRIDDAEQKYIDSLAEAMNQNAEKYKDALSPYLDKDKQSGVTGELQAQMTEATGSMLVGLWNMTAMDIRAIREYFERNSINGFEKELNSILNYLNSIDRNTRDTADNTDYNEQGFRNLEDKLDQIAYNTKPNNSSRG